jgi:hypothetical protein
LLTFLSASTNSTNGKVLGLRGLIGTVAAGGTGFSVSGDFGAGTSAPSWQVNSNASTVFQGITGASQLAAGMPVDMDVNLQGDGSLLATRVSVYDTNLTNVTFTNGRWSR